MLTGTLIAALVFTVGYTAIWSYFAYGRTPQASGEATVVVLGCKIQGDQPSLMLRRRLQRAEAYLKLNPQAKCVTSGGMGEGETYSEAYVMKKYLVSIGIEPSRIYPEEKSENTDANIKNSIALVKENNLSQNLVICTDGFHQLRAYMYARRNKVNPLAISGETPILVIPAYAVREFCGIIKMLTVG